MLDNYNNLDPRTIRAKQQYEGKEFLCSDGVHKFIVERFNAANDIDILFPESGVRQKKQVDQIRKGKVTYPFVNKNGKFCPIYFDDPVAILIGNEYKTNQGYLIRIIDAKNMANVTYQFQDQFGYIGTTTIQNIRKGEIRNPYHMNEFGGYLGEGPYSGDKHTYRIWYNILIRATGNRYRYECFDKSQLYQNCKFCNEWRNYNTFAHWYLTNLSNLNSDFEYEVDKDLLYPAYRNITEGYKLYSPATCVLLPHDLNILLININHCVDSRERRKAVSEDRRQAIIEATEYYKSQNAITNKTYNAIRALYYNCGEKIQYITFNNNGCIDYYKNAI